MQCRTAVVDMQCRTAVVDMQCRTAVVDMQCRTAVVVMQCRTAVVVMQCRTAVVDMQCRTAVVDMQCRTAVVDHFYCKAPILRTQFVFDSSCFYHIFVFVLNCVFQKFLSPCFTILNIFRKSLKNVRRYFNHIF